MRGGEAEVALCDPFNGEKLLALAAPHPNGWTAGESGFTALALSPDGPRLAVGSTNDTVLVYDIDRLLRGDRPRPAKYSAGELAGLCAVRAPPTAP